MKTVRARRCGFTAKILESIRTLDIGKKLLWAHPEKWHAYERIDEDTFLLTSGAYELKGLRPDLTR